MKLPEIPSLSILWRRSGAAFALFCSVAIGQMLPASTLNLTQYVMPFTGTSASETTYGFYGDSGDVFPGAAYPTGMVQWSPDTTSNLPGGYNYLDSTIKGFSLTHFSGRGIDDDQDAPFMPYVGTVTASPATSTMYQAGFSHSNESAQPGYYSVTLNSGIKVELTATTHTGAARFTFPSSTNSTIMVNSGGSVNGDSSNTGITIVSGSNEMTGYATSDIGGGNSSEAYTVYFVIEFDQPFASFGTWNGGTVNNGSTSSTGAQSGAFATFHTTVVNARAAISYVSLANAEANMAAENSTFNFSGTQAAASTAWNTVLNKVQVSGGTTTQMQTFYTALYHCFFHPNIFDDVNGQYMGMDKTVHTVTSGHSHQYENISGWDQYRSLIPLRAILSPVETSDIMQSEVNWGAQGGGGLPRWEQTNHNSNGMEGDGQSIVVASGYALGATDFDTASALTYMVNDLSVVGTESDGNIVQPELSNYQSLGYVPDSGSQTLELSEADFAVSQFAQNLGNTADYDKFLALSGNWLNTFDSASGFFQPRSSSGSWDSGFSPTSSTGFTEGSSDQYTWLVPYNVAGLVTALGGTSAVVSRLNTFFTQFNGGPGLGPSAAYCYIGNEQCEETMWTYDFVGDPSGVQSVNYAIEAQWFNPTPTGLPGNDDGGATSSWYVFAALGFYPDIPGVGGVVLGSPLFPSAVINLENGHQITITGTNASSTNPYVQSLTLNGVSSSSLWIPIETLITSGATLDFTLGSSPSTWGNAPADAPPSFPPSGGGTMTEINFDVPGGVSGFTNFSGQGAAADSGKNFWNAIVVNGTTSSCKLDDGTTSSPVTLTVSSDSVYTGGGQGTQGTPSGLQSPFYDSKPGPKTCTLANVPAGTYNLYLYGINGDNGDCDRGTTFTVGSSSLSTVNTTAAYNTFIQGNDYVVFTNIVVGSGGGSIVFTYKANTSVLVGGVANAIGNFNGLQLIEQ